MKGTKYMTHLQMAQNQFIQLLKTTLLDYLFKALWNNKVLASK